jgi:hypothetical protein
MSSAIFCSRLFSYFQIYKHLFFINQIIHDLKKLLDITFVYSKSSLNKLIPNPDKPELNIDDLRLKICGIASLYLYY